MTGTLHQYIQEHKLEPSVLRAMAIKLWIHQHKQDGVKFKAVYLKKQAGDDIHKKEEAVGIICETLSAITNPVIQDEYIKIVASAMDVKQTILSKRLKKEVEAKQDTKKQSEDLKRVRYIAEQVERKEVDITSGDNDLHEITEALASLGESARDYFHRICSMRPEYMRKNFDADFTLALTQSKIKSPYRFFKICDMYGLETKLPKTIKEAKEKATARDIIGNDQMTEDYQDYGIWEEEGVYKSLDQWGNPYTVSNFTMKILWHVETSADSAYRVVAIKNVFGKKAIINMNTDNFVSVGSFKKEVARKGNFLWKGNDVDLTRLQEKLQQDEKPTELVQNLGYHKRGRFYAFANGIYDISEDVFMPVDEYGIVEHVAQEKGGGLVPRNYFIPAMSNIYADKEDKFANDKKFIYQDSKTTFEEWSKQYCKVFGYQGEIALVFYIMCLNADIIFKVLSRRFPLLFVYGKRGTGKGTMVSALMRMFGHGQDQIMLGGASTTKGFMRKFAQYINAIVWLDEYKNNLDKKNIESFKNIYDRIGYERAKTDQSFETESMPVHSGCILSGQEMPTIEAALFTRVILTSLTETKFTEAQKEQFRVLERMEEGGLSHITTSLMKFRPKFAENFKEIYYLEQKRLIKDVNNNEVEDRMFANYAAFIATADIINSVMPLPFNMQTFRDLMKRNLLEQFFVLKGSDDSSKFWDVVEDLFNSGLITEDRHFILNSGYLYIRISAVYQHYAEALIKRRDPNVLDQQTLYKYLESDTKTFIAKKKKWFSGQGAQLWSHQFNYAGLNVNLIKGADEREVRSKYKEMNMNYVDEDGDQAIIDFNAKLRSPRDVDEDEELHNAF